MSVVKKIESTETDEEDRPLKDVVIINSGTIQEEKQSKHFKHQVDVIDLD